MESSNMKNKHSADIKYEADKTEQNNKLYSDRHVTNGDLSLLYEKFGVLSGSSSVGLIITDTNGIIISFNKTVQDLFGISIDEYINTNIIDLYAHPQDRQQLLEMLQNSHTIRNFQVQFQHKDGTLRDVLANIDSVEFNGKNVLLTSVYDITQIKNHKESEGSYRTLFSNAPVGITVTDRAGKIIVHNNAIEELLSFTAEDLKEISARDFYMVLDDRKELLELTRRLGSVRDFETKFRDKAGRQVPVLINTDLIDFSGQKNMLLTSVRDISHLKEAENELTRERDFSNAILNIAATLIVVIDKNGMITRFNRACEHLSGYSFQEIKGTYLWETDFFEPMITREQIKKLLSEAYPGAYETKLVSKSGEKYQITWTFAAMRNTDGQVEYIIATGLDITKRQKAEEELQKANQKLEAWVRDLQARTEEMNQVNELGEQLQSCQTIAEACMISARYINRICPLSSGALYLINSSRNLAEVKETWGKSVASQEVFEPLSCWAIRRGRQHLVDEQHPGLLCRHITGSQDGQYLCVPLTVNGEAIGILYFNMTEDADDPHSGNQRIAFTEHKTQLVTTIAEHIALAISNLKLKETLRQQSIRDALTGLFNRRYMEETLERELNRAQREQKPVGVIMFDIDHFKKFNDLAGHDAGDALLRELGAYLNKDTRGGDIVCRYGGEEFLAVLPGADLEATRQRAEQMREDVSEMLVYHLGKPLAKCTISLGVAVYPENGAESQKLLKTADNALYRAKNEGRNKVVVA